MKNIVILLVLTLILATGVSAVTKVYCGDGICHVGEESSCPTDCRCEDEIVYVDKVVYEGAGVVQREVTVPFFQKPGSSKLLNTTCGYDANLDGLICDPNEDFVSCPQDCERPSLDSVMCIGATCAWQEAWFARTLLLIGAIVGIFLFVRSRK